MSVWESPKQECTRQRGGTEEGELSLQVCYNPSLIFFYCVSFSAASASLSPILFCLIVFNLFSLLLPLNLLQFPLWVISSWPLHYPREVSPGEFSSVLCLFYLSLPVLLVLFEKPLFLLHARSIRCHAKAWRSPSLHTEAFEPERIHSPSTLDPPLWVSSCNNGTNYNWHGILQFAGGLYRPCFQGSYLTCLFYKVPNTGQSYLCKPRGSDAMNSFSHVV